MHGFFFLWPALLFFGVFKILLFVLLIMLVVRFVSHGHRHAAYAHGHGYGHRHDHGYDAQNFDPRRVAAWRYASGTIDRAEFDRIISGLDASTPTTPPSTPAPPAPPAA